MKSSLLSVLSGHFSYMQSAQRDNQRSTSRPRGGRSAPSNKSERTPRQNTEQKPKTEEPQNQQRKQFNNRERGPRLNNIHLTRDIKDIKLNDEQTAIVRDLDQKIANIGEVEIPSNEILDKEFEKIEKEISKQRGLLETYNIQIDDCQKRQDAAMEKLNPHKKEFDETDAKIKEIDAELQPIVQTLNEIRARRQELVSQKKDLKEKIPGRSLDDIDDQIDAIEYEIETSTLSNTQLKSKLSRIESLKKARAQFSGFAQIDNQLDKVKVNEEELYKRKKALQDAKNKLWDARKNFIGERDELRSTRAKFDEERKGLFTKVKAARAEINRLYDEKKKTFTEFREKKNALLDKKSELRVLKNKRLQIYQEAERRMDLVEMRARKAGPIKEVKNPNEEKINAARSLIAFLQGIVALDDVAKEEETTVVLGKATKSSAMDLVNSVKKQSKKEKLAAKKGKKAEEQKKEQKIELSLQAIQQFSITGVTQPTTIDQIGDVIAQLKAKDAEWSNAFIKLVLNFDIQPDGSIKSQIKIA